MHSVSYFSSICGSIPHNLTVDRPPSGGSSEAMMCDLILTAMTVQGKGAICSALTGAAPAQIVHAAGSYLSRAHGIFVTGRTQNIHA